MNQATELTKRALRLVASIAAFALLVLVPSAARADDALTVNVEGGDDQTLPFAISAEWQDGTVQNIDITENGGLHFEEQDWGNLEYANVLGHRVRRGDRVEFDHPDVAGIIVIVDVWNYGDTVYIDIYIIFDSPLS